MKTFIILGGNSQLAACIRTLVDDSSERIFISLSSKEVDITDLQQLHSIFKKYRPQVVINCAAYTAVDQAEEETEKAESVNGRAPADIARCCKEYGALLIHISTDFVFDGSKATSLTEKDQTNPLNVYGRTKLDGERGILENWKRSIIIRTSWLYSEHGHNFVKTMLRLGKERDKLGVVADQIGSPTYAMDLASLILKISDSDNLEYGIYHFSNEGVASWYDFAHAIFSLSKMTLQLIPLNSTEYPTKAKRPTFSVLDKSRVKRAFAIAIPHWHDSLSICLRNINNL